MRTPVKNIVIHIEANKRMTYSGTHDQRSVLSYIYLYIFGVGCLALNTSPFESACFSYFPIIAAWPGVDQTNKSRPIH